MKKHIKLCSLILALTMLLAGCGNTENTDTSDTTASNTTESTAITTETTESTQASETAGSTETTESTESTTDAPVEKPNYDENLVFHLDFDEWSGDTIEDVTGNGHDAKVHGNVNIVDGHDDGKGVYFGAQGDYLVIANTPELNFTETESFTLSFWYCFDENTSFSKWPCIMNKGTDSAENLGVWISNAANAAGVSARTSTNPVGGTNTIRATTSVALNEWHQITIVQDAVKGTITTYVDGVAGGYVNYPVNVVSESDMYFGVCGDEKAPHQFIGMIDDVKLYDCALDAATIQGFEETEDKLIAHWSFDAIENGVVADLTGNGHDGSASSNLTVVAGKDGNAAQFTGSERITVADAEELNFVNGQSFTLSLWFKRDASTTSTGKWSAIVQKGLADSDGPYYGFWLSDQDYISLGLAEMGTANYYSNTAVDTEWHHAVMIQNGETNIVYFYLDGVLQNSTKPTNTAKKVAAAYLRSIGESLTFGSNGADGFRGLIDDIKIYNYAVDESEILAEYEGVDAMANESFCYVDADTNEALNLPYRVYLPEGYDANGGKTYPMLFFLHGHGETGLDNVQQLRVNGGDNKLMNDIIARGDCIIVAPQCTCDGGSFREWIDSDGHRWSRGSRSQLPETPTLAMRAAMALLDEYLESGKVDLNRVYAAGISMGGYGTWELLTRRSDVFAAAIPLCGAGIPSEAAKLVNIDIWAFHGTADTTVPVSGTKDMETAIAAAGGTKMKAAYLEGIGHSCWAHAYATDGLVDWLFAQTKAD